MRLNQPTKKTFYISMGIAVVGVLGKYLIGVLAPYAFLILLVGYVYLVLGNTRTGM